MRALGKPYSPSRGLQAVRRHGDELSQSGGSQGLMHRRDSAVYLSTTWSA